MPTKILVIDDERPTLSMFKLHLDLQGYEVFTAENGNEGMALFQEHSIPIVLTDVRMPGIDGMEVLKQIKEQAPRTEVIIITGHGDMDLALKALGLGATDFINKPIQQKQLNAALKRAEERIQLVQSQDSPYAVRTQDGIGIIDIKGAIHSGSESQLREAFATARTGADRLVLSFTENITVNGAGIALLTQLLLECEKGATPVAMAGLPDNFIRIFAMVGMNKLAAIHDTEEQALAAV
ncbi:MAG: response regulator [Proteobacteria bacterium]|nr:response regulator [Pseudomonadota bacterium]MBU1610216.1 response regulator [Pseudomonadota bacterium]